MRLTLLPGIWPPDVGGPATHGPELARFLVGRGHGVTVVTMASHAPTERPCRVVTVDRSRPFPLRYGELAWRGAGAARAADVVYASATYAAAAAAAAVARKPLVAKLVSDPAYERARRSGLFSGSLEDFQTSRLPLHVALRGARTAVLRRARALVVPSRFLAGYAAAWGLDPARVHVVPNPAPAELPSPNGQRAGIVFAGRLTTQKALHVAIDALASVPDAVLTVIGDGPERARLEAHAAEIGLGERVRFVGPLPREEVLAALAAAEVAVLPSAWENFPHAAVEALAVGTPLVATNVGGVTEIVRDGVNGLVVPPHAPARLADALRRVLESSELRERLSAAARESAAELGQERVYGRIEELLVEAAR